MKKKLSIAVLGLVALLGIAATTMRVSEYPNRPIPQDADLFLLASVANSTNYNTSWLQIKAALGVGTGTIGSSNVWATNVIVTRNLYASNGFFTNLTVQEGITNASLTPNTVLKADANKRISSIPNAYGALTNNGSGVVGYDPSIVGTNEISALVSNYVYQFNATNSPVFSNAIFTNLVAENIWASNAWFTNIVAERAWISNLWATNIVTENLWASNAWFTNLVAERAWISNLWATNIWVTSLYSETNYTGSMWLTNGMVIQEHAWDGPTNLVKCGITNRYYFTANTPCAITQLVAYASPNWENHSVLEITNASPTNITITVHAPIRIPVEDSTRVYTLTNGNVMACSLEVATMGSNSVLRAFKP